MAASTRLTPAQRTERSRIAALTRSRPADDPELLEARHRFLTDESAAARDDIETQVSAIVDAHIRALVDVAPPLTDDQKDRLRTLLDRDGRQLAARGA